MKAGDLVRWTFAKTSDTINPKNNSYIGILLYPEASPVGSWIILLSDRTEIHADITEIEVLNESR
jgi:hypothetical protein